MTFSFKSFPSDVKLTTDVKIYPKAERVNPFLSLFLPFPKNTKYPMGGNFRRFVYITLQLYSKFQPTMLQH